MSDHREMEGREPDRGSPGPPAGGPPTGSLPPEVPLGQRLFDSPFLLLAAGMLIMVLSYTVWGLWEILTLTEAPLP